MCTCVCMHNCLLIYYENGIRMWVKNASWKIIRMTINNARLNASEKECKCKNISEDLLKNFLSCVTFSSSIVIVGCVKFRFLWFFVQVSELFQMLLMNFCFVLYHNTTCLREYQTHDKENVYIYITLLSHLIYYKDTGSHTKEEKRKTDR